jgi:CheY-like chemotaxis protein
MILLTADDQIVNRKLLRVVLEKAGYTITEAENGTQALEVLDQAQEPVVALIDWEMPELEGIEVCRRARLRTDAPPMFLIVLTVRDSQKDVVAGLHAGANDYMTKPFDQAELLARVNIGVQMVTLQQKLTDRARELEEALEQVKQLSGILPICSYCKKIRDDKDYWQQVESYISHHSEAQFSHSICPVCYDVHVQPELDALEREMKGTPPKG